MTRILQGLSCLLLSLPLYSQSNISEAEARALMEDYLNYCLLDQHPVLYQRYFDLDAEQDEDGIYLLNQNFHQYKILAVQPPRVEVLASYEDQDKWDRIFTFQLKKEKDTLLIVPQKINYWDGYHMVPYLDERAIARPFTPSDLRLFKSRALAAYGYEESEVDNDTEALLGGWVLYQCKGCQAMPGPTLRKYVKRFSFGRDGHFGKDGAWFFVDGQLFIRFPGTGNFESFEARFLKDSTLWISQRSDYGPGLGLHLIPADRAYEMTKDALHPNFVPEAEILIQPHYGYLQLIQSGPLIFEWNGQAGLMDTLGNILIPAAYDKLSFADNTELLFASKGNKTEVFDMEGKVLKTLDLVVGQFQYYFQHLIYKNGKMGVMDSLGTIVIEPTYDDIKPVGFGNYRVCLNDKWGLLDQEGQEILPVAYEGLEDLTRNLIIVKEGRHYGVMDTKKGKLIVPIAYNRIKVRGLPLILAYQADKAVPYRLDGTRLLDLEYDNLTWLGQNYLGVERDGKRGVINSQGETVLPIQYDNVLWVSTELRGLFEVVLDGEGMVVDSTGAIIPEAELEKRRKIASQLRTLALEEWKGEEPELTPERVGEDYALFDQDGQMVIPPVYEGYPMYTSTGHLIVEKRGFTGVIDQSGKAILPFIFDEIDEYWSSGLFLVSYKGRTGLIRIPKKQNK